MRRYQNEQTMYIKIWITTLLCLMAVTSIRLHAQEVKPAESAEYLAKKLSNPIASLISVPFQNNLDVGVGQFIGTRNALNFQPIIPIHLYVKFNLIARVVPPFVTQYNIAKVGTDPQQAIMAGRHKLTETYNQLENLTFLGWDSGIMSRLGFIFNPSLYCGLTKMQSIFRLTAVILSDQVCKKLQT